MNQQLGCHCYNRCHLSVSEIDVEKGMDVFSKVVDQFGEEHHKIKQSAEYLEQQSEKAVQRKQ